MDEDLLCQVGFPKNLAHVYRLLMEKKSLRPTQLKKITHESRANCYALLDKLVELNLAKKIDIDKKLTYIPESPEALVILLNKEVTEAQSKLKSIQRSMPRMLSVFNEERTMTKIKIYSGKTDMIKLYQKEMESKDKSLFFIRSRADIHFFGLEQMESIRYMAKKFNVTRYGLTPILTNSPANVLLDSLSKLKRTWLKKTDYTANVEWAVTDDLVHIFTFAGEGDAIEIKNKDIAESLRQILKLLIDKTKTDPSYTELEKLKTASNLTEKQKLAAQNIKKKFSL